MKSITATQWKERPVDGAVILDVRSPGEFTGIHAEGAINLPLDQVTVEKVKDVAGENPILLLCQGGTRAKMAAEKISEIESQVSVLDGGTQAWKAEGLPVLESKGGVISLERQVRIGAGAMVLGGLVASEFLDIEGAQYLSLFVGAGLVFAGVTDTCAMGLILAKMPWNQKAASSCGV